MEKQILDLGELYVSDFLDTENKKEYEEREKAPLTMIMDNTIGAPRLTSVVDPDKMYGKYWYRSGTNLSMTNQLKNIAEEVSSRVNYKKGDVPPPHYHPNDEQWIYLLSGKLAVLLGNETTTAESGDLVYIPRNTIHGIRVLGDECVFFTCKNKSGEGGLSEDYTGVDNLEELIEKLAKHN